MDSQPSNLPIYNWSSTKCLTPSFSVNWTIHKIGSWDIGVKGRWRNSFTPTSEHCRTIFFARIVGGWIVYRESASQTKYLWSTWFDQHLSCLHAGISKSPTPHTGGEKLGFSSLCWEGEQGGPKNDPILHTKSMTWELCITYIGVEIFGEVRPVIPEFCGFPS